MGWSSVKRIALLINSVESKAGGMARRIFNTSKAPYTQWVHIAVCIKMINISTPLWTKLSISFLGWQSQSTKTLNDLSASAGSRAKNQILVWLNLPRCYCSSHLLSHLYCIEVTSSVIQWMKIFLKYDFRTALTILQVFCLVLIRSLPFPLPQHQAVDLNFYCVHSGFCFGWALSLDRPSELVQW